MALKMRILSPFLVIAIVLSLVAGVIAVSPAQIVTAVEYGNTTLTVEIIAPLPIPPDEVATFDVCQYFYVNAMIYNTGDNPATGVSALLSVSPETACSLVPPITNPVTLALPIPVGAWAGVAWNLHCEGAGEATITVDVTAANALQVSHSITIKQVPPPEPYLVVNITSPGDGEIFSTCQNFDLVFTVSNRGEAGASKVTATIDPGLTAEVDDNGAGNPVTIDVGTIPIPGGGTTEPITVGMHCEAAGDSTITVTPAGTDSRTQELIPEGNLIPGWVTVHQELKAHLVVEITEPYDDRVDPDLDGPETIYSTCHDFTVSATVTNTGEAVAEDVWATVSIAGPGAASVVVPGAGANPQYLGDLDPEIGGGSATATWTLHCDGPGDVTITVTAAGTDENTGQSIPEDNLIEDSVTVGQEGEIPPPEEIGTRTLGFYKNHPCVVLQVLPITIAGEEVTDVDSVIQILEDRKTHWSRLRSQLMATKLNVAVFGIGDCTLDDLGLDEDEGDRTVNEVMGQAEERLLADPGATKDQLSAMQDLLASINNSNDDAPLPEDIAEACPPGNGNGNNGKGKGK